VGGWGVIQLLGAGRGKGKKSRAKYLVSGSYRGNEKEIARQANEILEECAGSIPNPACEAEDGEGVR
jgi:hypothetical protein